MRVEHKVTKKFLVSEGAKTWQKPIVDGIKRYILTTYGDELNLHYFISRNYVFCFLLNKKSLVTFFNTVKILLLGFLDFRKSLAGAKVGGVHVGRYIVSTTMRSPNATRSRLFATVRKFCLIIKGAYYYTISENFLNTIEYSYLHDTNYLMGIVNDVLMKKRAIVFLKGQPFSLFDCQRGFEEQTVPFVLRYNRQPYDSNLAYDFIVKRIKRPNAYISYLKVDEQLPKDFSLDYKKKNAIVYAHSFTDAQLAYGYDGFDSVYSWLMATVAQLLKNDYFVIIKAHPNFYAPSHQSKVVDWDKKIWGSVVKRLSRYENIQVLDFPMFNCTLLQLLERENTLLVSHHGNAVVEGAAMNFKTISSECSLWGRAYKFGEVWGSQEEYFAILEKELCLYKRNSEEAIKFVYDKYMMPQGFHGKNYWRRVIASHLNCSERDLQRFPFSIDKENIVDYEGLIEKISYGVVNWDKLTKPEINDSRLSSRV